MRVLDLFAGLGGWSAAFRDRGHDVITLDNDPRFGCDITADVREPMVAQRLLGFRPQVILASPPCETFSTLAFQRGHYRLTDDGARAEPATDAGRLAVALVHRTVFLIRVLRPAFAIIENPRALLRTLDVIPFERRTVWYCHLGHELNGRPAAKPTDLWGMFPPSLELPGPCHNRRPSHGSGCCCHDHVAAPRGSRTGTQGPETAAERAKVPYQLSLAVCLAAEHDRISDP